MKLPTVNEAEETLAFQVRAYGLPVPVRNWCFVPERKLEADFGWPDHGLLVEVQGGIWRAGGGAHSRPKNIERDIEKAQLAALRGLVLLPVTPGDIKRGEAVQMIERLLHGRCARKEAAMP